MIQLKFEGWFECRLATDPDPSDEPRGISGWTFAVAGEPDLDRIIRLQPESSVNRINKVGVFVKEVLIDRVTDEISPLIGAKVDLLDNPVFEGRNGIAYEDTLEPVYPFHIKISKDKINIQREFRDMETGDFKIQKSHGMIGGPKIMQQATGMTDRKLFRQKRKEYLEEQLLSEKDEIKRIALTKRIKSIDPEQKDEKGSIQLNLLYGGLKYRYILEGPYFKISDPQKKLDIIDGSPWIADFWMGVWDTDALNGYISGEIIIPSTAR